MPLKKILFIDRDGTLIIEPEDKQIDSLEKLKLLPGVIPALLKLSAAGFHFVMVSNQDGLGTAAFPEEQFLKPHQYLLDLFASQGIFFDAIHICPHLSTANCYCRKPNLGLVLPYLTTHPFDRERSYVIGDRETDTSLANNMGINSLLINQEDPSGWKNISQFILHSPRIATVTRQTKETSIELTVNLNQNDTYSIQTGLGFFDHMLEQLAKHGQFGLTIHAAGDLHVDEHHLVEDVALTLGHAIKQALGDKRGIHRYGFLLPMDEALATIALDLSGRAYCKFEAQFNREYVGHLATELIPHFFRSFSDSLGASLHIKVTGENAHHMIEATFKGVGKTLFQAISQSGIELPSTKGVL